MNSYLLVIAKSAALVLLYIAGTQIGQWFSVPPGYASIAWPASGVGLAAIIAGGYRYGPAVFLATLVSIAPLQGWVNIQDLLLPSVTALAATLQAMAGAWLIKKSINKPLLLEDMSDALKLIVFGAFLTPVLGALVGTFIAFNQEIISENALLKHFLIWWLGDAFGIAIFTPLFLIVFSPDPVSFKRRATVAIALLGIFSITGALQYTTIQKNIDAAIVRFKDNNILIAEQLQREIDLYQKTLASVESFVNASNYVSADQFKIFTSNLFEYTPGLAAISWIPYIKKEERESFEESIREQGYADYQITRRLKKGRIIRSEDKPFYLPVAYIEPYEANRSAHGLDVYGVDPLAYSIRFEALENGWKTNKATATEHFPIIQNEGMVGVAIYHPILRTNSSMQETTKTFQRDALLGFVGGILYMKDLVESYQPRIEKASLEFVIFDRTTKNKNKRVLYDSRTSNNKFSETESYNWNSVFSHKLRLRFAERKWHIAFLKPKFFTGYPYGWQFWAILFGSVAFASLFSIFTMIVTARNDIIERIVDEKVNELEAAENFQTLVAETIPDLFFVKDNDFKIVQANPAFINMYPEEKRNSIIGYTTVEEYDKDQAYEFLEQDRIAFSDGYSEVEEKIDFPNGKTRILNTKKVRFEDEKGNLYILGVSRDITQQRKTQDELIAANAELEEFAYRTSHDLRAPIASSIGLLQVAEQALDDKDMETASKSISHIKKSLGKLDHLISDILVLTQTKNIEQDDEDVNLDEMIDDIFLKLEYLENFRSIKFEKVLEKRALIRTQKTRLVGALENLISNAIKYADPNNKHGYVRIEHKIQNTSHVIRVIDNGIGVPKEKQDKLFGMFQRFHSKISFGSGLGLYIVKKSIEKINGKVTFEGTEHETIFRIVLPVKV